MKVAFYGSSLLSSYWNGAATYYRGIIKALAARGHEITFYEPDAFERQQHRDIDDPEWAEVVVYQADEASAKKALESLLKWLKKNELKVPSSGTKTTEEEFRKMVETQTERMRANGGNIIIRN